MSVKIEMEIDINTDVTEEQIRGFLKCLSIIGVSASIINYKTKTTK